jgi:hypothetical protein
MARGDLGATSWLSLSLGSGVAPIAFRPQTPRGAGNPRGRNQPMATDFQHGQFGDFRTADYIELSWLGIDVLLRDIFVGQRKEQNRLIGHWQPSPLEHCVLEGVGSVANRLDQEGEGVDHFIVEIAGYVDDEDNRLTFQFRPSVKMVWNKTNDRSPRLDIYIPNNLSRNLVELFVTKRIDKVELLIQTATIGKIIGSLDLFTEDFALLADTNRSHCGLLSVTTSLQKN